MCISKNVKYTINESVLFLKLSLEINSYFKIS